MYQEQYKKVMMQVKRAGRVCPYFKDLGPLPVFELKHHQDTKYGNWDRKDLSVKAMGKEFMAETASEILSITPISKYLLVCTRNSEPSWIYLIEEKEKEDGTYAYRASVVYSSACKDIVGVFTENLTSFSCHNGNKQFKKVSGYFSPKNRKINPKIEHIRKSVDQFVGLQVDAIAFFKKMISKNKLPIIQFDTIVGDHKDATIETCNELHRPTLIWMDTLPTAENPNGIAEGGTPGFECKRHYRTLRSERYVNHEKYMVENGVKVKKHWKGQKSSVVNGLSYRVVLSHE